VAAAGWQRRQQNGTGTVQHSMPPPASSRRPRAPLWLAQTPLLHTAGKSTYRALPPVPVGVVRLQTPPTRRARARGACVPWLLSSLAHLRACVGRRRRYTREETTNKQGAVRRRARRAPDCTGTKPGNHGRGSGGCGRAEGGCAVPPSWCTTDVAARWRRKRGGRGNYGGRRNEGRGRRGNAIFCKWRQESM